MQPVDVWLLTQLFVYKRLLIAVRNRRAIVTFSLLSANNILHHLHIISSISTTFTPSLLRVGIRTLIIFYDSSY